MHRKRPHSFWFLWKPCACMRVRRGMHRSKQDPISRDATRELTFQPPATETSNTCCSIDFSSHLPPHRCFCTDWVARPRSRVSALPHLHWPHQQVVLIPSPKSASNMPTPFLLYCHHSQSHPFHLLPPQGSPGFLLTPLPPPLSFTQAWECSFLSEGKYDLDHSTVGNPELFDAPKSQFWLPLLSWHLDTCAF